MKKLQIHVDPLTLNCTSDNLLDALRSPEVWAEIEGSVVRVAVVDVETNEYADIWFDGEMGDGWNEWETLSAELAAAAAALA